MDMKEAAEAYENKRTENIADLDKVSVNTKIEPRTFKEGTPEEFKIQVALVGEKEYRVPWSVLAQIKTLLADPRTKDMKDFRVLKTGEGMNNTKYTVIPLGL